jgi:predicted TIM-barrel fold metal-dependent hydrolase
LFAESKSPQFIDAHVHVWTPDTERYPLAEGYKKSDMKPASFTPEQLFAHCRPTGVSRIVLIQMSYYQFDNSYMLDMMKKFSGVFSGVGIVDENNHPVRNMLKQARHGVRGFRIQPKGRPANQWLNSDAMNSMWQVGAKHGLAMCHLINAEHLASVGEMCKLHPDTPVVIDHFARVGVDGEIRKAELDQLCALAKHKNVSVKISAYYALGKKQAPYKDLLPMIKRCLDAFGPERLMWASDGPFQVVEGHEYAPSIDLIKQADFLSAGDKDLLLRGTAERVFFQ